MADTLVLDEVTVWSQNPELKEIKIGKANGKSRHYTNLNITSFEIGSLYQLSFKESRSLTKIEIPIKLGK